MLVQAKKVVAFGGGTGLSFLLEGLKAFYPMPIGSISAVVAVSDDGGSTGTLRKEFHIPAPGDIRRCIVALSRRTDILKKLFEYRFNNTQSGLHNHAFGNLMLTALKDITGSFSRAVDEACNLLDTVGRVLPLSEDKDVTLVAEFDNGEIIRGEVSIYRYGKYKKGRIVKIWLEPKDIKANPAVIEHVLSADILIFGPGSLYTSVISSFLHPEVTKAIRQSKAKKVYVANLFADYGEAYNFSVSDHVLAIEQYLGGRVLDAVVVNTRELPKEIVKRYKELEGSVPARLDLDILRKRGLKVITGNLLHVDTKAQRLRHNGREVVKAILENLG